MAEIMAGQRISLAYGLLWYGVCNMAVLNENVLMITNSNNDNGGDKRGGVTKKQ